MVSQYSAQEFVVNGDLSKKMWSKAEWVEFDQDVYRDAAYPNAVTRVSALWTYNSVYFGFVCMYSMINVYQGEDVAKERWELWKRDVVEVFINPQPNVVSHYYEFEVAPNNQWIDLEIDKTRNPFYDASWNSGFEHATRIDNHFWQCEMRIPIASMGVREIRAGARWRLNFFRADGHGNDSERRLMSWCRIPEGDSFHTPTRFGMIQFSA